ncbi:MAG: phosphopantetheine-binding protein [Actinomycetota bacterium]
MSTIAHRDFAADLVRLIRSEVAVRDDDLDTSTDLVLSGLVDSLGVMLIVEWIETRLDIEIDPADIVIEHFDMVDSMVTYLRGRGDTALD